MTLKCQGYPNGGGDSGTRLVFPAGVNGVVFDNAYTSPNGTGYGAGGMSGCGIVSKGDHVYFSVAGGSNVITVPADKYFGTWDWHVGDGIIPYSGVYGFPTNPITVSNLIVPTGTTVTATNPGTHTVTVSSPVSATGGGYQLWRLPVELALTVNTSNGSPVVLVTNAPIRIEAGDYVWSDAFILGTPVLWNAASSLFTATNNFANGDALTVGNNTYHFVSTLGSTPGNVLVGANFAASAANLIASIMNTAGSGTTYVPPSVAANVDALTGTWPASATTINFTVRSVYNHYQYAVTTNFVSTYTGSAGSFQAGTFTDQTLTMGAFTLNNYNMTNASRSETGGHLWIIPAAFKTYVQTTLTNNWIATFPFGLYMECSDWASSGAGCNGSYAAANVMGFAMIGRLVVGDNAGASLSIMNVYSQNSISDIAELGAVGSNYVSENANSQEASTSYYGIIGACVNANSTTFWGGYAPTFGGYCANGFDVPTSYGGYVDFWNPIAGSSYGAPAVVNNRFYNSWLFENGNDEFCLNGGFVFGFGPASTSCTYASWTLTAGVFGPGEYGWQWYGNLGGEPMVFTQGPYGGYGGYTALNHALIAFPQGFILNDTESGGYEGAERLVDEGMGVPTGTFHKNGDVHFNQSAVGGSNMAWIDTYSFYTTLGGAVTSGTTTTVPVASCPSPALPAGTPIDYWTGGNLNIPVLIGTLASCTAGTLTFQAAAAGNAPVGGYIFFLQWLPAGPVANDPAGTQWTLGNYMTLTPVALASLPTTCTAGTFAVINNGVAAPVYNAAVGSTTGAATDPVFCTNGNVWKYH